MIDAVIGTDLLHGILLSANELVEVDKPRHRINLGMELVITVLRIHDYVCDY